MPTLKIDQIAICPPDPEAARELLDAMGCGDWAHDDVTATGTVFGQEATNKAHLQFNYTALERARELEVLEYVEGDNWMARYGPSASHLGMHCTEEELAEWRAFFTERGIKVAQEVQTLQHTNPVIAGKRQYHYVIFDTRYILGIDLKFIVRQML
jgi:hypothetical protein